jgi:hypothetical protein
MAAPIPAPASSRLAPAKGEHTRQHQPVADQPRAAEALAEQQQREQRDEHRHHARQHNADMGGRCEGHAEGADQEKRRARAAHHDRAFEPAGFPVGGHAAQQRAGA